MHPAARLQFERMIEEYVRWRAVPAADRSPAPAWWWGPTIGVRGSFQALPAEWCTKLGLPEQASYAASTEIFLRAFAGQTAVPWPFDFPGTPTSPDVADVRGLHPQPSDDSAFQP